MKNQAFMMKWRMESLNKNRGNVKNGELCLEHIARFIGAALRHPIPRCNSEPHADGTLTQASTIYVSQYKSKFNSIRIYCALAEPSLVKELWHKLGNEGEPDQKFKDSCLVHDAQHYRDCYLTMLDMLPRDVARRIRAEADYPLLLCDDAVELDAAIQWYIEKYENGKYPQYLHHLCNSYRVVSTFDDVRSWIINVCCFNSPTTQS